MRKCAQVDFCGSSGAKLEQKFCLVWCVAVGYVQQWVAMTLLFLLVLEVLRTLKT